MSHRRAAPLTASLLVRKGGASPSHIERYGRYGTSPFAAPEPYEGLPAAAANAPAPMPANVAGDLPKAANGPAWPRPANNGGAPELAVIGGEVPATGELERPATVRGSGGRAPDRRRRFTLRLAAEQHLRLRLAAVHRGISAQKLVLEAVEMHLRRLAADLTGGCACLGECGPGATPDAEPGR